MTERRGSTGLVPSVHVSAGHPWPACFAQPGCQRRVFVVDIGVCGAGFSPPRQEFISLERLACHIVKCGTVLAEEAFPESRVPDFRVVMNA